MKTVKIEINGKTVRVCLKTQIWSAQYMTQSNCVDTGVYLMGLWFLPKKKMLIAHQYSVWDNGKGEQKGDMYLVVTPEMYEMDWAINEAMIAAGIPLESL